MKLTKTNLTKYKRYLAQEYPLCQRCGKRADDLHHLFFGRFGADKDDRTMIAVCRDCHEWCHRNKHESQRELKHIADENWSKYAD